MKNTKFFAILLLLFANSSYSNSNFESQVEALCSAFSASCETILCRKKIDPLSLEMFEVVRADFDNVATQTQLQIQAAILHMEKQIMEITNLDGTPNSVRKRAITELEQVSERLAFLSSFANNEQGPAQRQFIETQMRTLQESQSSLQQLITKVQNTMEGESAPEVIKLQNDIEQAKETFQRLISTIESMDASAWILTRFANKSTNRFVFLPNEFNSKNFEALMSSPIFGLMKVITLNLEIRKYSFQTSSKEDITQSLELKRQGPGKYISKTEANEFIEINLQQVKLLVRNFFGDTKKYDPKTKRGSITVQFGE